MASRVHGPVEARPFVAPPSAVEEDRRDPEVRVRAAIEEGRAEGFAQGIRQGRQAAVKEANARLENLLRTLDDLSTLRARVIRAAEQDVLRLSTRIAGKIVREKIEAEAAAGDVAGAVAGAEDTVAMRALQAALGEFSRGDGFTVRCHPKDEEILKRQVGLLARAAGTTIAGAVTLVADTTIAMGGCVVQSEAGEIDVTIETQLQVIEHELLSRS